jgi:hypothetical protein
VVTLEEMTGSELRRLIQSGVKTVVIPFGSVEQHGGHLPLGTDAIVADSVGQAVADRLDAVLAPTIRVGYAERHMDGIGTLTIPAETLRAVAFHIAGSSGTHGFRVIVLISAHGANQPVLEESARRLNAQWSEVVACAPAGDVGPDAGPAIGDWRDSGAARDGAGVTGFVRLQKRGRPRCRITGLPLLRGSGHARTRAIGAPGAAIARCATRSISRPLAADGRRPASTRCAELATGETGCPITSKPRFRISDVLGGPRGR